MPVRLRITLLFTLLVFILLGLLCTSVYYFSESARVGGIKLRLTNRAITTARLLSRSEIFDRSLIERIDSFTTLSLKNKTVAAYDFRNHRIYSYSDLPGDTLAATENILNDARVSGSVYFVQANKEAVAYHYTDTHFRVVMIAAAEDVDGKNNLLRLRKVLVVSLIVGLFVTFTVGYFFSYRLLMPLRKIADDVNDISAQNFTRRIRTGKTRDEWFYLSDTINALLNRLEESFNLQKRFIANASHELSTPLTAISSQLEVSLSREREATEYRKVMQSIYQDVRQMSQLTQTLLEFARASGDPAGLEISPVRVDEILLQLPSEVARAGKEYTITLAFDRLPDDEKELLVYGNESLLRTAIRNIVLNACKYADDHHAHVSLKVSAQGITITVEDKGIGIEAEEMDKIFQPFYRIEDSRTTEGFGLGLSLAYRIVKLHRGNITVASEKGKGTTFSVELPVEKEGRFIKF